MRGGDAVKSGRRAPGATRGGRTHSSVPSSIWGGWINNQFGEGILTWNTPFLFRTRPAGSRLLICGPARRFDTVLPFAV